MAEENGAPDTSEALTDEQISQQFPGQDVAHIRAMMDKMDGKGVPADPHAPQEGTTDDSNRGGEDTDSGGDAPEYPEWLPEKFRSGTVEEAMERMAKSYSTLEAARGPADADGADDSGSDGSGSDGEADDGADALSLPDVEAEFVKDGKLSDDTYAKAEKAGMPREVLDAYIAGQQAIANQMVTKVHDAAGGPEAYEAMLQWAIGNLPKGEVEAYDAAMSSGREASIMLAVRGLKASYAEAVGQSPARVVKGDTGVSAVQGYQSKREMIDAMKDPRYSRDPAYRAEVARKIDAGNVW